MSRSIRLLSLLVMIFTLSGCYTIRALTLEARCGVGKDYVITPTWIVNQENREAELHMIGSCMNKSDLKGN
jgi:uncharacterized protein YceK